MTRALAAAALVCALAAPAAADLARGLSLFERGAFERAAEALAGPAAAGEPAALYMLGVIHHAGMIPGARPEAGVALLGRAAEAGHLAAQSELARIYRAGDGVAQDFERMMFWYLRAAEQGDVGAQLFVADGYAYGYGVPADPVEAWKWYDIALRYWGDLAIRAREVVAEGMTPGQIAEAKRRSDAWRQANPAPAE